MCFCFYSNYCSKVAMLYRINRFYIKGYTMAFQPIKKLIPIRRDDYGRYRIGQTNILLDLVIYAYQQGSTPETITDYYPTLSLDDVYLAIGYYLRHRDEIKTYLNEQKTEAQQAQLDHEAKYPPKLTREILLERLRKKQE